MIVHFDNVIFSSSSGPNTFGARLARALFEQGHTVADTGTGADVSLVFIEPTGAPLARRVVQRLDGIWSRPQDFATKNTSMRLLYQRADAVVWQSTFDMTMVLKHFGLPGHVLGRVIHNGTSPVPVNEITIPKLLDMRGAYDRIYACSANWHGQKRLAANVALFDHLRTFHPNSCLIVLGSNPDHRATGPHVFYAGSVDEATYLQVYSAADWLLHLAWGDHCPNTVIEALSQGTPVACSEVGGTKELVGGYGHVLKDAPFDFELYDYNTPPPIDVTQVADLPPRQSLDASSIADIDIGHVALKYVKLFEQVCGA